MHYAEKLNSTHFSPVRFSYNPYFLACFFSGAVFFSHNKLGGTTFWLVFSAKRTGLGVERLNQNFN